MGVLLSQQSTHRARSPPSGTSHPSCPLELAPSTPPPPQPGSQMPPPSPHTPPSWSPRTPPTCTGWTPGTVCGCAMGCLWVAHVLTVELFFRALSPPRRCLSHYRWPVPSHTAQGVGRGAAEAFPPALSLTRHSRNQQEVPRAQVGSSIRNSSNREREHLSWLLNYSRCLL